MMTLLEPPVTGTEPDERTFSFDEYVALRCDEDYELIDGRLVETQMAFRETVVQARLGGLLDHHATPDAMGFVSTEGLYRCFPDSPNTGRKPDVSFVAAGRLSAEEFEAGHLTIAPDLAVEIVSPNDTFYDVEEKVDEYLRAGVRLVWVVNPEQRAVLVCRRDGTTARLTESALLDGEDVLPGFSVLIADLFPSVAR